MAKPILTVVTPCLNAVSTLPQALESVRSQGLDDVEHVVVDGGSTDGTVELLRAAVGVKWISEADRGLSDAMNKGIALASGEYIGWLNADDFYLPGALVQVDEVLRRNPRSLWATGPCLIVDAANREIRRPVTRYKRFFLDHYSRRTLLVHNYIAAPGTFARRDAVIEAGGFDERFRYSMDYDLWLRISKREPPVVLRDPITAFRMAGTSLSMTGFERQFHEHAQNAREHADGDGLALAINVVVSRIIVLIYRTMRVLRRS